MTIVLPGYEYVFENEVYARDKVINVSIGEQIPQKEIVIPRMCTELTEEDVVRYLQRKAEEVEGAASLILPKGVETEEKSPLESMLMKLPDRVRNDIRGNPNCIDFIKVHTPARALEEGKSPRQYLHVRYGLIPEPSIRASQKAGEADSAKWYDAALSHPTLRIAGLGEQWAMEVLLENNTLPDKSELEVLLRHGTVSSRTLDMNRMKYSAEEAISVIGAVYHGLSSREQVGLLRKMPDYIIESALEELAIPAVIALHHMLMENIATQNVQRMIPTRIIN